jgi:hypothetical protein
MKTSLADPTEPCVFLPETFGTHRPRAPTRASMRAGGPKPHLASATVGRGPVSPPVAPRAPTATMVPTASRRPAVSTRQPPLATRPPKPMAEPARAPTPVPMAARASGGVPRKVEAKSASAAPEDETSAHLPMRPPRAAPPPASLALATSSRRLSPPTPPLLRPSLPQPSARTSTVAASPAPSRPSLPPRPPLEPERMRIYRLETFAPPPTAVADATVAAWVPLPAPSVLAPVPSFPVPPSSPSPSAHEARSRPRTRTWLEPTDELPLPAEDPDVVALVPWHVRMARAIRDVVVGMLTRRRTA